MYLKLLNLIHNPNCNIISYSAAMLIHLKSLNEILQGLQAEYHYLLSSAGFFNFVRWHHKGYRGLISQSFIKIKAYYSTSLIEISVSIDFSFHAPIGPGHSQCANCLSFCQTSSWLGPREEPRKFWCRLLSLTVKALPIKEKSPTIQTRFYNNCISEIM